MTDDQVVDILGALITAAKVSLPIMVALGSIGLALIVCGTCCIKRQKQIQFEEEK